MKKTILALVLAASLVSCGGASTEVKQDSTTLSQDTAVASVDSAQSQAADTVKQEEVK